MFLPLAPYASFGVVTIKSSSCILSSAILVLPYTALGNVLCTPPPLNKSLSICELNASFNFCEATNASNNFTCFIFAILIVLFLLYIFKINLMIRAFLMTLLFQNYRYVQFYMKYMQDQSCGFYHLPHNKTITNTCVFFHLVYQMIYLRL